MSAMYSSRVGMRPKRAQIAAAYQRFVQQADVVSLMVALRDRHPVKIAKRPEADKQP